MCDEKLLNACWVYVAGQRVLLSEVESSEEFLVPSIGDTFCASGTAQIGSETHTKMVAIRSCVEKNFDCVHTNTKK